MNSDTEILVAEILEKSGALTKCSICGNFLILAYDNDAERMAYGIAENSRKAGERGFRGMQRDEVVVAIKRALVHASDKCPSCG